MPDLIFGLIFWVSLGLAIVYAPWAALWAITRQFIRLRGENAILSDKVRALMTRIFELADGPHER